MANVRTAMEISVFSSMEVSFSDSHHAPLPSRYPFYGRMLVHCEGKVSDHAVYRESKSVDFTTIKNVFGSTFKHCPWCGKVTTFDAWLIHIIVHEVCTQPPNVLDAYIGGLKKLTRKRSQRYVWVMKMSSTARVSAIQMVQIMSHFCRFVWTYRVRKFIKESRSRSRQ